MLSTAPARPAQTHRLSPVSDPHDALQGLRPSTPQACAAAKEHSPRRGLRAAAGAPCYARRALASGGSSGNLGNWLRANGKGRDGYHPVAAPQ